MDTSAERPVLLGTLLFLAFFLIPRIATPAASPEDPAARDTTRSKLSSTAKSQIFYDSIYHKFQRGKFSRLLYNLAFVAPPEPTLPDSVQKVKAVDPYLKYHGKVIRSVRIMTLGPFGPTPVDTGATARTAAGRALNSVHITTRKYIIRRQLLFKKGDTLDPVKMSDNLRILRELPSIHTARMIVTQPDPAIDSVDVLVITQDVWSIGFDIPVITMDRLVFRLYDANFLGLSDRFTSTFSMELDRAPFFRYDGASYTYTNIAGSYIDANGHFNFDDDGNVNFGGGLQRAFFATHTRWAGGADFEYNRAVFNPEQTSPEISYFTDQNLWVGEAFPLKKVSLPTRFILSEAAYWRNFLSRPPVTADSNSAFFNRLQLLISASFSRNNYYITDYLFRFGIPENVPYGRLVQLTLGKDWNDFYSRYYGGITLSVGNYVGPNGYLSGSLRFGGFLHDASLEDAVFKAQCIFISPLVYSADKRYRLRFFVTNDYKAGINFRLSNHSMADINQDISVSRYTSDTVFRGTQILAGGFRAILYSPWFFYGFRFALMFNLQAGFIADQNQELFHQPLLAGIGTGIYIRNDNLIFPTLTISFYFYPNHPPGVPWFQVNFLEYASFNIPDFNVSSPHTETLEN
ncbi:MAG TPA: hypothetical protein VMC08_11165 [Bacteroidales bacterium]|nr:hypothetical protein [Bacteroidales bacterium]